MNFTIKDPPDGLCGSCRWSTVARRSRGPAFIRCNQFERMIQSPMVDCSRYLQAGSQTQFEMEDSAWVLEVRKGKVIGFTSPEERRKRGEGGAL